MAITLVRTTKSAAASSTDPVTLSIGTVAAGNLLVILVVTPSGGLSSTSTPTGNSNTYTSLFNISDGSSSHQSYYVKNANAGATTISIANPTGWSVGIIVREYSGIDTVAPLDKTKSATDNSSSSTAPSSGASVATTQANELVVGLFTDALGAGQVYTAGATYGNMTSFIDNNSLNAAMEDKIVVATGAQTATATLGTAWSWTAGVATFKAAAGGTVNTSTLTAALSFTGAQAKLDNKKLTGALSFTGSLSRFISHVLTGALSFTGRMAKFTIRIFTAALRFLGSIISGHVYSIVFSGRLSLGAFIWYAGSNSVDGGNNTGWSFT